MHVHGISILSDFSLQKFISVSCHFQGSFFKSIAKYFLMKDLPPRILMRQQKNTDPILQLARRGVWKCAHVLE